MKCGDFKYSVISEIYNTCEITDYTGSDAVLNIPSQLDGYTVTRIGYEAFCGCSSLTNVIIPDSVRRIGWSAFRDCSSLTSVTIPDSVTDIGYSTFERCTSLTDITIPNTVTDIDDGTFWGCTSLKSVTMSGVTDIGTRVFYNCSSLTDITIPIDTEISEETLKEWAELPILTIHYLVD